MASCSQSFFLHKKQNFAKCEQGLILENMSTLHRAYLGADKQTFEGGGGAVISEIFCRLIPRRKKIVAMKIIPGEKNYLY